VSPSHHGKLTSGVAGATGTLGPNSYMPGGTVYQYGMASGFHFNKLKHTFKYIGHSSYHKRIHAICGPHDKNRRATLKVSHVYFRQLMYGAK
jgi:hypothetical protein